MWLVLTSTLLALLPGDTHITVGAGTGVVNPIGIDQMRSVAWLVDVAAPLSWLALWVLAGISLVLRFRRADGDERQQIKWLAYAMGLVVGGFGAEALAVTLAPALTSITPVTTILPVTIVAAVAIAVMRHRLYDIDLLINRTLVYGALGAVLLGIYLLVVGWLGAVFQARGNPALSLLATGMVAVVFAPLRDRLQRLANRLLNGDRDDPYRALFILGRRLESPLPTDAVLPVVARSLTEALKGSCRAARTSPSWCSAWSRTTTRSSPRCKPGHGDTCSRAPARPRSRG